MIEQTIADKNLDCLRIYEVTDSGTEVRNNRDVQEILQLIASKVITGLVVADLDRLFRPAEPTDYAILQSFKDTGAIIYSGITEYDLSNKESALFTNIRSAISGWELALLKERQQGAIESKRISGGCPTNYHTRPLGADFNRKTQRWFWNERAADVIAIFESFDKGERNYSELGRRFGLRGQTIRNTLGNAIYSTGIRTIDKKCGEKRVSALGRVYRKTVMREADQIIRVKILEPIVSVECFERVQRLREVIRYNHQHARTEDVVCNLGAGVAFCAYCNDRIYCASGKKSEGRRYGLYVCKRNSYRYRKGEGCPQPHQRQAELEELLLKFTFETLARREVLVALLDDCVRRNREIIHPFPEAVSAEAQLESLLRKDKRLVDGYADGIISGEELRLRRETLRCQIAAIRQREAKPKVQPGSDLEKLAARIVRGAIMLKRIADRHKLKSILMSLLTGVWFKGDSIVAFRLSEDIQVGVEFPGSGSVNEVFHLAEPFRVNPQEAPVPAGYRRCSRCGAIKPRGSDFRKNRRHCKACANEESRVGYLRRKAQGKSPTIMANRKA